jgi:hypothetical protein
MRTIASVASSQASVSSSVAPDAGGTA